MPITSFHKTVSIQVRTQSQASIFKSLKIDIASINVPLRNNLLWLRSAGSKFRLPNKVSKTTFETLKTIYNW